MKNFLFFYVACGFLSISWIECGQLTNTLKINEDVNANILSDRPDLPPVLNQTEGCGGVLSAKRGYIGYNMNNTYRNNERCVWTIRTDKVATMIQLRWQGFVTEDHIDVYTLDSSGVLLRVAKLDKNMGNKWHEFLGPVIFLTFTSDQYGIGTGFYLEYLGFAYVERTGFTYNNYHLEGESGNVSHTAPEFPRNELVTYILTPVPHKSVRLRVGHVNVVKMYTGCPSNYFSVHQLFQSTFELRLRYCEPERDNAIIRSSSPILITFFATTSPSETGFSFSWDMV